MKFPIEMYKIREEDMKIQVPCERCLEKRIIDHTCSKCGGKGVHSKTIKVWKVAPKTVTVEKIDRSDVDKFYGSVQTSYKNGLRYWTSLNDYYNEANMFLHFTKDEAQKECDCRNADIKEILNVRAKNQTAYISRDCNGPKAVIELDQKMANMDSVLQQLGCSKVIDLLKDSAVKMAMRSAMTTAQAFDKMYSDIVCDMDSKGVVKAYLYMN